MLERVRVLDLTHRLAGPFATLLLAQMGAEVIKVEPPDGDLTRLNLPQIRPGVSEYFATVNQGKYSVCIDLRHERGREVLFRLAKVSDAIVDNFRPGVLARLGVSIEALRQVNPDLISVSLSGFGPEGPDRDRPALDILVQGLGGMMSVTGEPDGGPQPAGVAISDLGAGLYAAVAVLAGIVGRDRGKKAGSANISLLQSQLHLMLQQAMPWLNRGTLPPRLGAESPVVCPYGVYPTADGWIAIACRGEDYWREFVKRMGLADLLDDPRFADNNKRIENRQAINEIFRAKLSTRTTQEWLDVFEGLLAAPVYNIAEALSTPQVKATQGVVAAKVDDGITLRVVNNPIRWEGEETTTWITRGLGADTRHVLTSLAGYSDGELEELREVGAVRLPANSFTGSTS